MMALAVRYDMVVRQFDVTTAYGTLKEKIFMEVPEHIQKGLKILVKTEPRTSCVHKRAIDMIRGLEAGKSVCLLKKAIYGLRQSGRCWSEELYTRLTEYGAQKSTADPCLYYKGEGEDRLMIAVYVDDILVPSRDVTEIDKLGEYLSSKFEIKSLGPVRYCLGIDFRRDKESISMTQKSYIKSILERFGMTNANTMTTPLDPNAKLKTL